ncbi:hypothetical protein F5887DRAFT_951033 [Amanita rubescens]|nr:hypothetical protein F5887DRAFT_951033 [Amanita rubescens]
MLDQFLKNRLNDGKNAVGLWALASSNAIPGFDLSGAGSFPEIWLFTTKSTKTGSWMEPLRRIALSTYQDLNVAVAKGDEKNIKRLTTTSYQDDIFRMLKKNQNFTRTCIWRFHREISPTKVLSIRGVEGNLGVDAPKIGNRMMLHALIKFDTEQSLEIYDKRGKALHKSADGGPAVGLGIVPAERRKVTEYLVLEKRMWYDGPWMVREQMYESPPTQ